MSAMWPATALQLPTRHRVAGHPSGFASSARLVLHRDLPRQTELARLLACCHPPCRVRRDGTASLAAAPAPGRSGGVCLYAHNISSPGQLGLTEAITAENPDAIIAIDEEGGDVTRLFADTGAPFPGNAVLGRLDDLDTTRDTAAAIGWALRRAGCTVDFAPCVDVNSQSDNPVIGVRSFSSDAEQVARHGRAWVSSLQSTGVAATAKHFPGHGDTALTRLATRCQPFPRRAAPAGAAAIRRSH